ncbi:MAG: beta-N-acetylhexosaminidase [Saprospiraceae bacterium]|nr:beta-N-acetylhexosaminidase [Saprospiraceae bacterium]
MKNWVLIFGVLGLFIFLSCKNKTTSKNVKMYEHFIIPAPNKVFLNDEKVSEITFLNIYLDDTLKTSYLEQLFHNTKRSTFTTIDSANVTATIDTSLGIESYVLDISRQKITIRSGGRAGLQYAFLSLSQVVTFNGYPLPQLHIEDSPKFTYRGMHLDVGRHFFNANDVKKYIDYMAYYKFNNFHWHLTEDQGWRIEIKKYPKLQQIAAFRKETLIGHYNDNPQKYDGKRYGGFYTQDEVKDIVAYATARNINVIPEIEMPGHAQAALAAYPELGCRQGPYEVATKWGIFEDVYCPNEKTFTFLQDVIDEIITLFPGKYIHIGGDECPKTAWEKSELCQKIIKDKGIELGEHGLQSYFINRMEKYINSKGKQIIGWDEILEGGLAPNATVMSWRGIEGGIEAARQNHDVIMTPGTHCYFDHYQSESPNEPLAIGGFTTLEKVYSWNPIPDSLEVDKHKYILGGQANLWTEYIPTYAGVEYMAYAREMAMSEALWSESKDYSDFLRRYDRHTDYWKSKGVNMAYHVYELKPKIMADNGKAITVSFDLPQGSNITYKVDGKTMLAKPGEFIKIDKSAQYVFSGGKDDRTGSSLLLNFDLHKATNASIAPDPGPNYSGCGVGAGIIINGITGSERKYGG